MRFLVVVFFYLWYYISMKKKTGTENALSEGQKIVKGLTGQVGVDKETLISSIHRLRKNGAPMGDVALLGLALYKILIENGLNESDVVNPDRLLSKVDAFVYEGKFEKALEILEVLDALELYEAPANLEDKVYYVATVIEADIIFHEEFKTKKEEAYILSRRPHYLNLKTDIYMQMGRKQDAERAIAETLELNPCNFDALLLKARLLKDKSLEKFKKAIFDTYETIYTKQQMIAFYFNLAEYYEKKKDFYGAYLTLLQIRQYEDESLISADLARLETEMNKTALSRFVKPTKDEIKTFCQNEKIPTTLPDKNLIILAVRYKDDNLDPDEKVVVKKIVNELLKK